MEGKKFKNLIFDLGGVIINLDEQRTIDAFVRISGLPESEIKRYVLHFESYLEFEKGLISDVQFRDAIRHEFKISSSDQEIDNCMNAMLLDIPKERIDLLQSLNSSSLFLLSNTNKIHLSRFNTILNQTTGDKKIDAYFKKAYYSHLVNMRKPDKEIFELVLDENKLDPEQTLFLDDNLLNLEGANSVGIKTFHVKSPSQLFELFK